jgi:hypothetical protein
MKLSRSNPPRQRRAPAAAPIGKRSRRSPVDWHSGIPVHARIAIRVTGPADMGVRQRGRSPGLERDQANPLQFQTCARADMQKTGRPDVHSVTFGAMIAPQIRGCAIVIHGIC